jgi:phospholipid transport system substrate-binding protein
MKNLIAAVILTFFLATPGIAGQEQTPQAAEALLKRSIEEVFDVLQQTDLSRAEQQRRIESIVDPVFNYELIARLSLGPRHWPRLDQNQRERFIERFVGRLKDSYFENIAMYRGDVDSKVTFGEAREDGGRVHIPVSASMEDASVEMVYKFHFSEGDGWRVYDVEINGVSIVASYRSQFSQVLQTRTIDEMIDQLETIEDPIVE